MRLACGSLSVPVLNARATWGAEARAFAACCAARAAPTSVRVAAAYHAAGSRYPPARALPVVVLTCGGAWSGCMLDV